MTCASKDRHANPSGNQFDLGCDGAFDDYTVLFCNFPGVAVNQALDALKKKGFTVTVLPVLEFIAKLPTADVAVILSTSHVTPQEQKLVEACIAFHESGGGLYLWTDNDPLFVQANSILAALPGKTVMMGNTPGGKVLTLGNPEKSKEFGPHMITSGIVNLFEGITISYPSPVGIFKVLATSSDGNPCILYADNEVLDPNCGRIVCDTGWTKFYCSWDDAGTARYIVNSVVWLLGLEYRVMMGKSIEGRSHGKTKLI